MSKFGYIDKERVSGKQTGEFVFTRSYGGSFPVLTVRPVAPTLNPEYTNAFIRARGGVRRVQAMQQRQMAATDFSKAGDDSRAADRDLYPRHVVVGWDGVVDIDGKPVAFTTDDCRDFLAHIDDYVFDELRAFCMDAANFVEVPTEDAAREVGNG